MLGIVLMAFGQLLHVSLPADGVQIRLVSGNGSCSGRVEVYHGEQWGTVCDDDWDMNDAAVVCRELGCGTALSAPGGAQFGQGTGEIWMDDVGCSGSESSLSQCSHRGLGEHNCGHGQDAGAVCSGLPIRLVSGNGSCSGRVEVYHGEQWGTVCDDRWDMNDAAVVCRQLGCGTALSAPGGAQFGQGTGEIWMDDVGCSGNESSLSQCSHRGFGEHNCNHGEDAGAVCSGPLIRLVGGQCRCSGRVEVNHKYQWGTVCDDDWGMNDAAVVCRQLGCGTALSAPGVAQFGQGNGTIWMDDVGCSGNESSLSQCSHRGFGEHNCNHGEDAGAVCSGGMSQPTLSLSSPHSVLSPGEEVRFRCIAPADLCAPVEFCLHRVDVGSPLARKSESRGTSVEMGVNNVDSSHQGSYTCLYAVQGSQTLHSSHSNSIAISVVVLQQPAIVLSSPTGEVTGGPQGPEVIEGHSFTITCSTVPQYPGGSFHLSFPGSNLTEAQAAVNHSASFIFSAAELYHQGNYSCVYETTVSGRKFSSPASPLLPLTVTASLILPITLGASAGGLLLVLVPLVLFLLFWKRRRSSGRTQVAKIASNARTMNPSFAKGKASEEEDEQDYENVETLTGHDYEEEIGDEDSGSEADYVNYREPTENKFSEDENIYQNS